MKSRSDSSSSTGKHGRGDTKFVYRTLRLISDWALVGFYSDVCVQGENNVRQKGALILCPCHHNEILDIGTLCEQIVIFCAEDANHCTCSCNCTSQAYHQLLGESIAISKSCLSVYNGICWFNTCGKNAPRLDRDKATARPLCSYIRLPCLRRRVGRLPGGYIVHVASDCESEGRGGACSIGVCEVCEGEWHWE